MRKFALIAAMVLVSATAQAGQTRSLTMASAESAAASTPPAQAGATNVQTAQTPDAATPSSEAPKLVERPAAVDTTTTTTPKADGGKQVPQTAKADKPRHKKYWTEARIINELHRHGIYW
jgi:hypothetical protein